jgi:glycosyltransferase involved in cell wall biosynthesis
MYLVAGDGSRLPAYQRYAEHSPAAEKVRFLGYVEDIRSFYAACDIIVLPSRSEGCPNVVLESMAMRRALVVSNAAGTREVVAHEREALLFPIGDVAALSDAVRRLIEQPELRRELEARAHQRVESAFSTRASTRELADLLHIVVDRARAPQAEVEVEAAGSLMRYPPVALARPRPWWIPSRFAGGGRP